MNIINKILILIIILVLINYLLDGQITEYAQKYYLLCKNRIIQKKTKIPKSEDNYIDIYTAMKRISLPNFKIKKARSSQHLKASNSMMLMIKNKLIKNINLKLKEYNYNVSDIKIISNNIHYLKNTNGKYYAPFDTMMNINSKNNILGTYNVTLEIFIDNNNKLIIIDNRINNNDNNTDAITDNVSLEENTILNNNNNNNNNKPEQNDIFLKSKSIDEDSLIPSSIHITENLQSTSYITSE